MSRSAEVIWCLDWLMDEVISAGDATKIIASAGLMSRMWNEVMGRG
jgi:hypothetical protein